MEPRRVFATGVKEDLPMVRASVNCTDGTLPVESPLRLARRARVASDYRTSIVDALRRAGGYLDRQILALADGSIQSGIQLSRL
jgi:hypothetical protein